MKLSGLVDTLITDPVVSEAVRDARSPGNHGSGAHGVEQAQLQQRNEESCITAPERFGEW